MRHSVSFQLVKMQMSIYNFQRKVTNKDMLWRSFLDHIEWIKHITYMYTIVQRYWSNYGLQRDIRTESLVTIS